MHRPIVVSAIAITLGLASGFCFDDRAPPPRALAAENAPSMLTDAGVEPQIMEGLPAWYIERVNRWEHRILDNLGENRSLAAVPSGMVILKTVQWTPGATITVAFKGGSPRLHALIERLAIEWSRYANIKFDFGRDASGRYRLWSADDQDYTADVRVAFDKQGYWASTLGKGSVDPDIMQPGDQTMNLQDFDRNLPFGFAGVIRHEFGHVLGLEHEHQHPITGCDFRWTDDDGYESTTDTFGQFIADKQGRHPGIYTVMGGPPNKWSKDMIDSNLRQLTERPDTPISAYGFGPLDKFSIMKYYYADSMFISGKDSACYSPRENYQLSEEDKRRIALFYPKDTAVVADRMREKRETINAVLARVPQASLLARELQRHLQ